MTRKVYILIAQNIREEMGWEIIGVFNNLDNTLRLKEQMERTSLAVNYTISEYEVM